MLNDTDQQTVDGYIAQFPAESQQRMQELRALIKKILPETIEDISYQMPAYRLKPGKRPVIFFGCYEHHIGLYAIHGTLSPELQKELAPYVGGKGTIQLPNGQPLPIELIKKALLEKRKEFSL